MPWRDDYKIIFVHIPKTGGSSIQGVLHMYNEKKTGFGDISLDGKIKSGQHLSLVDIEKYIGYDKFSTYTKIAVCRNPYTRFVSEFHWRKKHWEKKNVGIYVDINTLLDRAEHAVRNKDYYDRKKDPFGDHFIPQSEFIFDSDGTMVIDRLFRFENFKEIEKYLIQEYGCKKCPKNNQSVHQDEKKTLTQEHKDRIYDLYRRDFELLGYDR